MSIVRAIEQAFKAKKERGWDKIYVAVDIHGTILKPDYEIDGICTEFYKHSTEVLYELNQRDDIVLILYTCSHPDEIDQYRQLFRFHGIEFDYVNSNPEVKTGDTKHGYYEEKFYFNILFEDKASFDPYVDWLDILNYLKKC
jgi:hypothetical protein